MRHFISLNFVVLGLLMILISSLFVWWRRGESGAYWLTYESSAPVVIHRRLPDGRIRNIELESAQDVQLWDWSPDGRWLLFSDERAGERQLFRVHISGAPVQQLTEGSASYAAYSPDGEWIIFAARIQGDWAVHRLPADGGEAQPLTEATVLVQIPTWSPDGAWIISSTSDEEFQKAIYRMRPDGDDLQKVYATPFTPGDLLLEPVWSPDGEWIVFSDRLAGTNSQIYRVRSDGSDLQILTNDSTEHFSVVFAADGLYFSSNLGGAYNIFRLNSDAPGQPEAITSRQEDTYVISASPDGAWLLSVALGFSGGRGPYGDLTLIGSDGSRSEYIRALTSSQLRPAIWSPLIDLPYRGEIIVVVGGLMMVVGIVILKSNRVPT